MTSRTILRSSSIVLALGFAGCGTTDPPLADAFLPIIDGVPIIDSAPDMRPPMPVTGPDRHTLVSAAGQLQGGGYTLVFELGHATGQDTRTGGGFVLETASTVKP
jgi:hypothetical protein